MTQEEKRIAILEHLGWKCWHLPETDGFVMFEPSFQNPGGTWIEGRPSDDAKMAKIFPLPDYFNDLNACREMVAAIPYEKEPVYMDRLFRIILAETGDKGVTDFDKHNATAAQRCEAFGLALGLW